jgi:hypothetical protein
MFKIYGKTISILQTKDQFKHVCFSLIAKHVRATYVNHFQVCFLEQTTSGAIGGMIIMTQVGLETYDHWVEKQTPKPLGPLKISIKTDIKQTISIYSDKMHTISILFSTKMLSFFRKDTTSISSSKLSLSRDFTNIFIQFLFFIFISTFKSSAKFSSK